MTSAQMIQAFKVGYDVVNLEGPGYEDTEIYVLLNQAQEIEIQKEMTIRRWSYISNIIEFETGTASLTAGYLKSLLYIPSKEYIGYISSQSRITRITFKPMSAQWVENILTPLELIGKYIQNGINRHILLQPRIFEETKKSFIIIYDSLTTFENSANVYLNYIRKPISITAVVDCEVNLILHNRIVNTAVNLAKKVFNPNEAGNSAQSDALINKPLQ